MTGATGAWEIQAPVAHHYQPTTEDHQREKIMALFKRKTLRTIQPAPELRPALSPAPIVRARGSVISLAKTGQGTISLRKGAEAAHDQLSAKGLLGIRAGGRLWIDRSGSMRWDFGSGAVQDLAEMVLGFMFQFTAAVEVRFWDSVVHPAFVLTIDNYRGAIAREHAKLPPMGSTDMAGMLSTMRHIMQLNPPELSMDVVLSDGNPNDYRRNHEAYDSLGELIPGKMPGIAAQTTPVVIDLARYPTQIKFVGVRQTDYLQMLDDLEDYLPGARLVDNVDTKIYEDLGSISPEQFSADMADEWDTWIAAATAAGVLAEPPQ